MNRFIIAAPFLVAVASTLIASASAAPLAAASTELARWTCIYIPGAGSFCGDDGYNPNERPEK